MADDLNPTVAPGQSNDTRGIGHPNKILQRDFGGLPLMASEPQWVARLETYVFVEEAMLPMIQKGFHGGNQQDKDRAAEYLMTRVPANGKDPVPAKRMIAAAIGASSTLSIDVTPKGASKGGDYPLKEPELERRK